MSMFIEATAVEAVFLGNDTAVAVYVGNEQVWPN